MLPDTLAAPLRQLGILERVGIYRAVVLVLRGGPPDMVSFRRGARAQLFASEFQKASRECNALGGIVLVVTGDCTLMTAVLRNCSTLRALLSNPIELPDLNASEVGTHPSLRKVTVATREQRRSRPSVEN